MHSNGGRGSCLWVLCAAVFAEVCEDMMLTLVVGALTVEYLARRAIHRNEMQRFASVNGLEELRQPNTRMVPVASSCGGVRASPMRKDCDHQARKCGKCSSRDRARDAVEIRESQ